MSSPPADPASPTARAADGLIRTLTTSGRLSLRTLIATDLVREATSRRVASPTARSAVARAVMGAILLASQGKNRETVQLELRGDGPLGHVVATSDDLGRARGAASNPAADPRLEGGRPDLPGAIGNGLLCVSRRRAGWSEPQTGMIVIETGEVARDLALYLTESEQVPSAVGLSIAQSAEGDIEAAAGFLVQALPDAGDDELSRVEANIRTLGSTAELVRRGEGADALLDRLVEGIGSLQRHRSMPVFHCPCSRERALQTVKLLGEAEIGEIVASGSGQEVRCEFCGQAYELLSEELRGLLPVH